MLIKNGTLMENIEKIWADKGMVKILTKDGKTANLTPEVAAERTRILNRKYADLDRYQPHLKKHHQELIEQMIETIKNAKYQVETADENNDDVTKSLYNGRNGRTPEGVPVEEVSGLNENVEYFKEMYPYLDENEIGDVLRSEGKSFNQKEKEVNKLAEEKSREIINSMNDEDLPQYQPEGDESPEESPE